MKILASGRRASAGLAFGLSVCVHALLLALLGFVGGAPAPPEHGPLIDTRVYADLTLVDPTPARSAAEQVASGTAIITLPILDVPITQEPTVVASSPTIPSPGAAAGASAPGSGTGPTGGTFFPAQAASTVVYLIDSSGSMGLSGGLSVAKRELLASLEQLPETTRFQVIFYNRDAVPLRLDGKTDLVRAHHAAKQEAARRVMALRAQGSTDHVAALQRALAFQPDVIFWVTDADELTPEQVRRLTALNHGRTVIHAIELSSREPTTTDGPLALLTHANRGSYRVVPLTTDP
jgi:hypothetical protein